MGPRGRRGRFLLEILAGSAALVVVGLLTLVITQLGARSPGPGWVHASSVEELKRDGVVYVPLARAYVVAADGSSILAPYARSPHLGQPIRFCESSGWFEDPIHGSKFDRLGRYAVGPAPRGLARFEVRVVGEEVWVNPTDILTGPPRGEPTEPPSGPFCMFD
jgi:nitrite reductase/ring-hydroxylating ferredoxin subunit